MSIIIRNEMPRPSASLILLKKNLNPNSSFNYKLLLLKREKKMKYGNKYTFPGGSRDPQDFEIFYNFCDQFTFHSYFDNENKIRLINAFRETLEEVGLLFLEKEIDANYYISLKKKLKKDNRKFSDYMSIFPYIRQNFKSAFNFMRLITPQFIPARYDTYFYILPINETNVLNWAKFYNTEMNIDQCQDYKSLSIEKHEFSSFLWVDPEEAISKFQSSEIEMPEPQFLMLTILSHFHDYKKLKDFIINNIELGSNDYFKKNPFDFPIIAHRIETASVDFEKSLKYPFCTLLPGDEFYPPNFVIENELDEGLKLELRMKYKNLIVEKQHSRCRIYFSTYKQRFKNDFLIEVQNGYNSPLNYLKIK